MSTHLSFTMSNGHASGNGHMPTSTNSSAATSNNGDAASAFEDSANGMGVAGPSNGVDVYPQPTYVLPHNEQIVAHLFHAGFNMGEYADTMLYAHQNTYRLHAIILSRSPFLAHLISTSPKAANGMHNLYVPLDKSPEITVEGFAVALGYLYSSAALHNLTRANARAVLAAGCLLGGMDDLCGYAYQACRDSITVDTINDWIDFIDTLPGPSDGTTSPSENLQSSVYGPYAQRLREDIFHFLVVTLPTMLDIHSSSAKSDAGTTSSDGRETLLRIFSRVPFDLFKNAMESATFQIGSDQERFKFAKAAIEARKRVRGNSVEETVVLAFGGGSGASAVHVTRKLKKRALFKVG